MPIPIPANPFNRTMTIAIALTSSLIAIIGAFVLFRTGLIEPLSLIKNAACKANSGSCKGATTGLEGFVGAADALISPMIIALIAVAPIAVIIGGAALLFGSRRGLLIIGSSLGALVFIISIKGIIL